MRRVSVVGSPGSGKSTVARALAASLEVPHSELDAIFHQPGWTQLQPAQFCARVQSAVAADGWVSDGNYSLVQPIVWARADTVVWLDPPRWRVMTQLVCRTVWRVLLRRELWNGNREQPRNLFAHDPANNLTVYAWQNFAKYRSRYGRLSADPGHLAVHRLRSRRDVRRLLAS